MRLLFKMDRADYGKKGPVFRRPSVRAIIRDEQGRAALVYSRKYNYYKFPGGGINRGETDAEALIREVREETGLRVIPESIREYGNVLRKERSRDNGIFIQDNRYYFCAVEPEAGEQALEAYEKAEGFELRYVDPASAVDINMTGSTYPRSHTMLKRDAGVLQRLIREGFYLTKKEKQQERPENA